MLLILVFLAACLVLWTLFGLPLCLLAAGPVVALPPTRETLKTCEIVTAPTGIALITGSVLGTLAAVLLLRRWGGPSLAGMGLRREGTWLREIILGAALGPVLFALILASELALGWATVERGTISPGGVALGALGFTGVALSEEVAVRGFVLQVLGHAWNPPAALIISSGLFAVLHALNPNATLVAVLCLVAAGLALAWSYFATGRLWLPIAFHWSWNFAQGPLFGFPVSGLAGDGILAVTPTGPDWATGGGFGPEASVLGLVAEIIVIVAILAWRRTGASAAATATAGTASLAGIAFLLLIAR